MSKDIWHSALEIPLFDDTVVFIDDLNNWHTGYTQRDNDGITDHDSGEIYTEENLLRWAYIKDLLTLETELERTRTALDVVMDGLKRIEKLTEPSYKNRNLEALALAVNTFSSEIIEQINQRNNNE